MKTQKWKRALSTILAGTMVLTSLSAAMTAFAAEDVTGDAEYQSLVSKVVEQVKKPAFDEASAFSSYIYDNAAGDMQAWLDANLAAARKLKALDGEKFGSYKDASAQVAKDVKAVMGEELTAVKEEALDTLSTKTSYSIYEYPFGAEIAAVDQIPEQFQWPYSYLGLSSGSWDTAVPSERESNEKSLKKNLTNFRDKDFSELMNTDVNAEDVDLVSVYKTFSKDTAYTSVAKYPSWLTMDVQAKITEVENKLSEVGTRASASYLAEAQAFQSAYPTPADVFKSDDTYAAAKAAFNELRSTKTVFNNSGFEMAKQADAIYNVYYYASNDGTGAGMKTAFVAYVQQKADAVVEKYTGKVTLDNAEEVRAEIAAVTAIQKDTTFGYLSSDADVQAAVAVMDKLQGELDLINGEDAAFLNGVANLKARYEANGNKFLVSEAEQVATVDLPAILESYNSLTDAAKTVDRVVNAKADYDMMVEAVQAPYFEALYTPYETAVNTAKANWGAEIRDITMADYAEVRADLSTMDAAYAKFTEEHRADENVVALHEYHTALQAAYDAALAEGVYTPSDFTYPEGVNAEISAEALAMLDTVLTSPEFVSVLANALGVTIENGSDLKTLVQSLIAENLYTNDMVTTIVSMIYPALEGMLGSSASLASMLEIYVLPSGVAGEISDEYAQVKEAIGAAETWDAVDWSAVTPYWNVTDEDSFYKALGQGLNGLNVLLNVILNDTDSPSFFGAYLYGIPGYRTTIVPLLEVLGCGDIMTPEEYAADTSTEALVRNLLTMILNRVYEICETPATSLVSILPQLAYFLNADGLKQILSPLVIQGAGLASSVNINLWDTLSASVDLSDLNTLLGGLITGAVPGFTWVDIDFAYFAGLGSAETVANAAGDNYIKVTADTSKAAVALLDYVGQVLNANAGLIKAQIPTIEDPELQTVVNGLLDTILKADPDKFVAMMIHFLVPTCEVAITPYNNPAIEKVEFVYPEGVNYGEDAYAAAPAALDALIAGFVNLSDTVGNLIYTDANIDSIADALVNLDPTVAQILSALGITAEELQAAADAAKAIEVTDKASFIEALTTVLSPFDEVLALVLAGQELDVFGYTVTAGDAYNSVVIPLLEVLGCTDVMSYADYQAAVAEGASPLEAILNQVFDRLAEILASPVDSLTKMLPNLAYFLDSNNLSVMLKNALAPLNTLLAHVDVDLVAVLSDILVALDIPAVDDIDNNLAGLVNMLLASLNVNIQLPAIDLHALASYGTAEQYESAMVIGGKNVMATRIVADQADVTGAVIGYLYNVLADETNKEVILGLLGDSATMVGGILDNLLGGGVAGFTNALFELLGLPVKPADGGNGSNGGSTGDNDNVETGDAAIATVAGAALLAAGAVIVLSRKKRA